MLTITNIINIPINPVSTTEDMISDSVHSCHLHLETIVVSEQRYILTHGYAITCETNR